MTHTRTRTQKEEMIREAMTVFGVDRQTATFIVRQGLGEIAGDIVGLTSEQRRALGLGQPLDAPQNAESDSGSANRRR